MRIWIVTFTFNILLLTCAGWQLVMKVPKGVSLPSSFSLYQMMTSNMSVNENNENAADLMDSSTLYKSDLFANWENKSISLLRLVFYKNGKEEAHVVFNTAGSSYNHSDWPAFEEPTNQTSWFSCDRIVTSSWGDLQNHTEPSLCSFSGNSPYGWTMAILNSPYPGSSAECANTTGWFYVDQGTRPASAVNCGGVWPSTLNSPQFVFSPTNTSVHLQDGSVADMMALFVDDCALGTICPEDSCWQDPLGQCYCHGYKCSAACVSLPCENNSTCVVDDEDEDKYTCDCAYGFYGDHCQFPWDRNDGAGGELSTGGVIGLCIGGLFIAAIVVGVLWCWYIWKHRDEEYGRRMTEKAVMARDFVRRSFHRLSGRKSGPPMKQIKESPPLKHSKGAMNLEAGSSSVFGATNPAFMSDDVEMTPPPDRRYTEFPETERQPEHSNPYASTRSLEDIHVHESASQYSRDSGVSSGHSDRYQNTPISPGDHRMPPVGEGHELGHSDFEVASSMSEFSSTSGHSDPRFDIPANLSPSEMISRDVSGPAGKALPRRFRPKPRSQYPEEPKRLAPQLPSKHITAAAAESRRFQTVADPDDPSPWQQARRRTNDIHFRISDIQEASV